MPSSAIASATARPYAATLARRTSAARRPCPGRSRVTPRWPLARSRAATAQVAAGGGTMAGMVKVTTYLTDIRHRQDLVPVREEFFGTKGPASTLVAVAALAQPDWLIEVEAIAVV